MGEIPLLSWAQNLASYGSPNSNGQAPLSQYGAGGFNNGGGSTNGGGFNNGGGSINGAGFNNGGGSTNGGGFNNGGGSTNGGGFNNGSPLGGGVSGPTTDEVNLKMLQGSVPGIPGEDYPIYGQVPSTSFECQDKIFGGYYADPEAQCQAFHICGRGGAQGWAFLCPNGTVFNQMYLICDWWFNFDCNQAQAFYSVNEQLGVIQATNFNNNLNNGIPNQAANNFGSSLIPGGSSSLGNNGNFQPNIINRNVNGANGFASSSPALSSYANNGQQVGNGGNNLGNESNDYFYTDDEDSPALGGTNFRPNNPVVASQPIAQNYGIPQGDPIANRPAGVANREGRSKKRRNQRIRN
eukprot:snap_masked-scaffold758_size101577-processed-gene-0.12 protein:Tk05295 transcript:snap_masked-scaffold758_size101577-processed-gene-0.12-mRNA-1 annotation:"hypothetical protein EAI_12463"